MIPGCVGVGPVGVVDVVEAVALDRRVVGVPGTPLIARLSVKQNQMNVLLSHASVRHPIRILVGVVDAQPPSPWDTYNGRTYTQT